MRNIVKPHFRIWLLLGVVTVSLLMLAFQTGDDPDSANCRSCKPPTPTYTPTPTRPPLQTCRISEIYFNEQLYQAGEIFTTTVGVPLDITLKLVDHQGQILIGANVDATVTQTNTVQAAAIPPLEDQSGTYDAVYTPANEGLYVFTFSASDFTGPRFLPCSAEALVLVEDDNGQCQVEIASDKAEYIKGEPINLTATLSKTICTNGVTATIRKPVSGITSTITLIGTGNVCIGSYPNTDEEGNYVITATAKNSSGQICDNDSITRPVKPTPTSTPIVSVEPPTQTIDLCGRTDPDVDNKIVVKNVSNLAEVDLTITFDPTFIIPSKITPLFGPGTISQTNTTIRYTAQKSSPMSGIVDLLAIDWRLQGRRGTTTIALSSNLKDAAGAPIQHTTQNGTLNIIISPPCLRCTVNLQGRADHSGVTIAGSTGAQAHSYPNGVFAIAATGELQLTLPGYLSSQMAASGQAGGDTETSACQVNLLAGDTNTDQRIDILDLAYLAQHYQSADAVADLNADGIVNILDLALVAGNYQKQGPLSIWQ